MLNTEQSLRIIGIDPGTRITGYGVIDIQNKKITAKSAGVWKLAQSNELLHKSSRLALRLSILLSEFKRLLDIYHPHIVCVELPFVSNNIQSALTLGTARGVILAETCSRAIIAKEISATSAKKNITGNGYASKQEIAYALSKLLSQNLDKLPFDATDALAIACSCAYKEREVSVTNTENNVHRQKVLDLWKNSHKKKVVLYKGLETERIYAKK